MKLLKITILLIICLTASLASAITGGGRMAGVFASYKVPQPPNAPTGVTATAGFEQNTVNWTAPPTDGTHDAATSYTLYGGTSASPTSLIYSGSATSYTHTGLTAGTPYYYRATATNVAGTSGYSSPDATSTPLTPPATGSLDFETASLTPYGLTGAYVETDSTYATRVSSTSHLGSYSYSLAGNPSAAGAKLRRIVTSPASGTYSFTRWFKIDQFAGTGSNLSMGIFNLFDSTESTGYMSMYFHHPEGIQYYGPGWTGPTTLLAESSMTANTWYRMVVTLTIGGTYSATVYNTSGSSLATATGKTPINAIPANTSVAIISQGSGPNATTATMYLDDIVDGF